MTTNNVDHRNKKAVSNDQLDDDGLNAKLNSLLRTLIPGCMTTSGAGSRTTGETSRRSLDEIQRALDTSPASTTTLLEPPRSSKEEEVAKNNAADMMKNIINDRTTLLLTLGTQDGMLLEHTTDALRADREVVLVAVAQNGRALKFASPSLQADKEVVLAAIQQHFSAFHFAAKDLRSDKDVMLAAVSDRYSSALNYATKEQKADRDIIMAAIRCNGHQLAMASEQLRADKEIVLMAVTCTGEALRDASEELRADKDVVMAAIANGRKSSTVLKYALGGLNQDRDCWIAAGLIPKEEMTIAGTTTTATSIAEASSTTTGSAVASSTKRKLTLSTKFSLSEQSKSSTTHLTALLAETAYFQGKDETGGNGVFMIYSPNAFGKTTCDPNWTTMEWPCRGTYDTCRMPHQVKTGIPTDDCCWRYSYRYHLEEAKRTNGFMMQVVDYDRKANRHVLGKGQQIETIMAEQVGTKVFRVCQPVDQGIGLGITPIQFAPRHISEIIPHIKDWYKGGCSDNKGCEIQFWSRALNDDWKTVLRKLDENEVDVQRLCPWNW